MMHNSSFKLAVINLIFLVVFASCSKQILYHENMLVEGEKWMWANPFKAEVLINDSINAYNLFIDLEFTNKFATSNLYLFLKTTMPNNEVLKDTVNCILADDRGKWLGKTRFGKIENHFSYKVNVRFPFKGKYKFEIEQAMRKESLEGVVSCGLTIKKFQL